MTKTLTVNYSGKNNDVIWDCVRDQQTKDKDDNIIGEAYTFKVKSFYNGTEAGGTKRTLTGVLKHEAWIANSTEIQQWARDNL